MSRAVIGPLLTLAVAVAADLMARHGFAAPHPVALLLLTVVYASLEGGVQPGLVSAVIVIVYGAHYFADPEPRFHYTTEGALSFIALAVVAPAITVLIGRRAEQWGAGHMPASDELEARRALQHDLTIRLAATSAVVDTLQSVARNVVPLLADWCLIQLRDGDGALRSAGAAHRRADRDATVRALAEQGWPMDAGESEAFAPHLLEPHFLEPHFLDVGADGLSPGPVLAVPLMEAGRVVGRLVLGREGAATFSDHDIEDATELALRIALAVAHARLARDAEAAESRHQALFESSPQPMWVFDVESLAILDVNDAAIRAYGYSRDEFLSLTIMDLRPDTEPAGAPHALERGPIQRPGVALTQHRRKDGSVVDVELISHEFMLGQTRARLVLVTDVTERARTIAALHESEHQLRHAQRMDMVGRLAGGIAHDFNNLLTAIQGYSELLIRDFDPSDPRHRDLEEIRRAAERGGLLTRQLLTFSGRMASAPRPVDVNAAIGDLETLIQRLVGADIRVATVLAPQLGRVLADPAQVEQVLITLVLAAAESMPRGGELSIETAERRVNAESKGRLLRPGRYVVLTIRDMGGDPTRRPDSDATLGMSIVYGIVRQLGGVLRVLSQPERGTTVNKVYLPRYEAEVPDGGEETFSPVGMETVLVAEDEEGVREMLRTLLTRHGYRVIEARHGRDALLESDRHPGPIHLLVTDIVMPEMGGAQLAEELLRRRPELKVIFISGYTSQEIERRGLAQPGVELLAKPFPSDDLIQRVRAVLDSANV